MHIPEDAEDDNLVLYSFGSLAPSAAPYRYVYRHNRLQSERMRVGSERIIVRTVRSRKHLDWGWLDPVTTGFTQVQRLAGTQATPGAGEQSKRMRM